MEDQGRDFLIKYRKLNESYREKLIFPLTNRGYASEINNLLLAIMYALINKRQLVLYDKKWNAGRWNDFFVPFCNFWKPWLPMPNFIFSSKNRRDELYKYFHNYLHRDYKVTDSELWKEIREKKWMDGYFKLDALNLCGNEMKVLNRIEKYLFIYNDTTQKIISRFTSKIEFSEYAAIHVRRGDKLIREANSFHIKEYVNRILEIKEDQKTFFIATDSYESIKEFSELEDNYIYRTFCEHQNLGHDQKNFNDQSKKNRLQAIRLLLVELEILSGCKLFVGTFSSKYRKISQYKKKRS